MRDDVKKLRQTFSIYTAIGVVVAFIFAMGFQLFFGSQPTNSSLTAAFVLSSLVVWVVRRCWGEKNVNTGT